MVQAVIVDKIELLEAQEHKGALRRMVRMAEVSGVVATDWKLLTKALDDTELPQYGDHLTEDLADNAYDLVLTGRNVRRLTQTKVQVELVYENWVDIEENLDVPRGGYAIGEVRCTIQQKTSNLDINGDQVDVAHTYPEDDPNFPDETLVQGGEFSYYEPERSVSIQGIKKTRTPWLIANAIIGKVNSVAFSGEQARYWLCTSCSWKLSWAGRIGGGGTRENRYLMNFEFQFNPDTWDPTVTYIDSVTNKPPPDLVPGVGIKSVIKMPSTNFNVIIGVPLQGG